MDFRSKETSLASPQPRVYRKKLLQFREDNDGETGSLWVACALSSQRLPP